MIEYAALLSAALAGFVGSGHCVAMCGALSQSLTRACGAGCGVGSLRKNLSRVIGYGTLGAAVGGIGNGALHAARALEWRAAAQVSSGVLMLLIGATLLIRRQAFAPLEKPALRLMPLILRLRALLPKRAGFKRDIAAGLVWSLLPCGMVYAALSAAWLSASALQGGLLMLCFGAGTLPALLGIDHLIKRLQTPRLSQVLASMLLLLGLLSVLQPSGLLPRLQLLEGECLVVTSPIH